jgi:hypothetical protein
MLEKAFEQLLDAEDIADVMRVQDPDEETYVLWERARGGDAADVIERYWSLTVLLFCSLLFFGLWVSRSTAYLVDRSKETIQKLYHTLRVYTPRGDVAPFSVPGCKYCLYVYLCYVWVYLCVVCR